jgi:hypothetical protein
MGWSFAYVDIGRKAHIAEIRSAKHFGPDFTPLRGSTVGNHIWQLVRQESANRTFITLDLIAKDRAGGWGYKGMSEDMGPYYYDCPLSLIDAASEPINESAREWRLKVRAHHAKKTSHKCFAGQVVSYGGDTYTLIAPAGPRKGWVVDSSTGCRYRMNFKQLARATWVNTEVA